MRATTLSDAPAAGSADAKGVQAHTSTPPTGASVLPGPVTLLLVGWTAVAVGIAINNGRYGVAPLLLVVVGTLLVGAGVYAPAGRRGTALTARLPRRLAAAALLLAALVVAVAPVVWLISSVAGPQQIDGQTGLTVSCVLASLSGLLAAATVLPEFGLLPSLDGRRWPFWGAVGLMSAAGVVLVAATGKPPIDVYYLLQVSTKGLVHGDDLYRQQWAASRAVYPSHGLFDVYPYLPWTSVLLLPFRLIFGDVRYGLVAFLALAAFMTRRLGSGVTGLGRASGRPSAYVVALLPLLLVVFPKVAYSERQSWTEPLLIALLVGMVLAVERGHLKVAVLCLALALASKQHIVLILPVAAIWPRFGLRRTVAAAGAAVLLVLPWVIAGPRDFWHDAVHANLDLGYRSDALCIATFVHKAFGVDPGFALTAVGLLLAYLLAWKARGSAYGFAAGAGLLVLALDITNTQSFFNHYTLGMALVAVAIVLGARRDQRLVENRIS